MKQKLDCPYCDGQAELQKTLSDFAVRKEQFKVFEHFYKCDKCGEEFTTTETDNVTVLQAHNQYRQKYNLPFPEEIIETREKYGLSATKMSDILGFGTNGYGNYENGELPTLAYGNLIKMCSNPETFSSLLEKQKNNFTPATYQKTLHKISELISCEGKKVYTSFNLYNIPNDYTGYRAPKIEKIASVISAFLCKCDKTFNDKLKINKLLFYLDFSHYKNFACSVTGTTYRAIKYGPVPSCYDNIFAILENENLIQSVWENDNGGGREIFVSDGCSLDATLFKKEEIESIDLIVDTFKNKSSWDMVDISHEEKAWEALKDSKEVISYQQYAFDLKGI